MAALSALPFYWFQILRFRIMWISENFPCGSSLNRERRCFCNRTRTGCRPGCRHTCLKIPIPCCTPSTWVSPHQPQAFPLLQNGRFSSSWLIPLYYFLHQYAWSFREVVFPLTLKKYSKNISDLMGLFRQPQMSWARRKNDASVKNGLINYKIAMFGKR